MLRKWKLNKPISIACVLDFVNDIGNLLYLRCFTIYRYVMLLILVTCPFFRKKSFLAGCDKTTLETTTTTGTKITITDSGERRSTTTVTTADTTPEMKKEAETTAGCVGYFDEDDDEVDLATAVKACFDAAVADNAALAAIAAANNDAALADAVAAANADLGVAAAHIAAVADKDHDLAAAVAHWANTSG